MWELSSEESSSDDSDYESSINSVLKHFLPNSVLKPQINENDPQNISTESIVSSMSSSQDYSLQPEATYVNENPLLSPPGVADLRLFNRESMYEESDLDKTHNTCKIDVLPTPNTINSPGVPNLKLFNAKSLQEAFDPNDVREFNILEVSQLSNFCENSPKIDNGNEKSQPKTHSSDRILRSATRANETSQALTSSSDRILRSTKCADQKRQF